MRWIETEVWVLRAERFTGEAPLPARTPSTLPSARPSAGALLIAET